MMQYESSSDEFEGLGIDSLNISNDEYYRAKLKLKIVKELQPCDHRAIKALASSFLPHAYGSKTIKHSIPAYDLWKAFFPTYLNHDKFCSFHRPKLRHYNTGPQSRTANGFKGIPIKNLCRYIFRRHNDLNKKVVRALRDGVSRQDVIDNVLRIRHAKDLSAKCGEIFLFEYGEEHPPVLSQVGMASNVKNYFMPSGGVNKPRSYKCATSKPKDTSADSGNLPADTSSQQNPLASSCKTTIGYPEEIPRQPQSLYFNQLKPGSRVQMIENNLYRAPIYQHDMSSCDFLIIRTRNGIYIRSVRILFVVGQTMPLCLIPSPIERNITHFRSILSRLYIHKLFAASETVPPSMRIEDLMRLFPDYSRKNIQKRLSFNGAETGYFRNERVIQQGTSNYGTLSWSQRCKIINPEQYCAFMASLAARERLRHLNYTESMINPGADVTVIEPEILAAPWNTSKAVQNLIKGNCYLDLRKHLIDPTGPQREGFSCVHLSRSTTEDEQNKECREHRKLAMEKGKRAPPPVFGKNPLAAKIRAEKLERLGIYRTEAQLIADTQAKVLACQDLVTSSEDEDDSEDDDVDDDEKETAFNKQLDDLERLVVAGQSISRFNFEKEEEERRQMLSELRSETRKAEEETPVPGPSAVPSSPGVDLTSLKGKILMIQRTYDNNGTKIQRTEIVREPKVIALYVNSRRKRESPQNRARRSNVETTPRSSAHSTASPRKRRSRSSSLGPSELCRADGMKIVISKKVLSDLKPVRKCRRKSLF